MNNKNNIIYIFMISFLINMVVLPLITTESYKQITFSINKTYLSIILGLLIVISHMIMLYITHGQIEINELLIYIIILAIYIYVYRNQLFIDDIDFLNYMKESKSTEIFINSTLKNTIKDKKILSYANFILLNSTKEISFINKIINVSDKIIDVSDKIIDVSNKLQ